MAVNGFAGRGYRTIGVAVAQGDDPWEFLGFCRYSIRLGRIQEHYRPAPEVRRPGKDGYRTTGDARRSHWSWTWQNIQPATGLFGRLIKGQIPLTLPRKSIRPIASLRFSGTQICIVKILQENATSGVTGRCLNDAPALKQADVGHRSFRRDQALESGSFKSDRTRFASSSKDRRTRRIFEPMMSYVLYRMPDYRDYGIRRAGVDLLSLLSSHRDMLMRSSPG